MRSCKRRVMTALLVASAAAKSGMARAECDPAIPSEPIASRFEIRGDTAYDKSTNLTWARCS